jgi:ankyrin repeat protein
LGADIHARTKGIGFTPLLLSVLSSQVPAVEILLARGANVNDCDATAGWSAVHCAAKYGNGPMIRKLVEKGAKVDVEDKEGFTPWMYMVGEDRNWEIAQLLIELGADVNYKMADKKTVLHWILLQSDLVRFSFSQLSLASLAFLSLFSRFISLLSFFFATLAFLSLLPLFSGFS